MPRIILIALIITFSFIDTKAQSFEDLDKSPMDAVMARNGNNSPFVRVIYSRPKKRGREILGNLVPHGEVWRTGANEATEIRFYNTASINGQLIEPGTYTLFVIPNKNKWTFIINSEELSWGTENYDEANNLISLEIDIRRTATIIEDFSISLRPLKGGTSLLIGWDDTFIEVPIIKIETPEKEETDDLNESIEIKEEPNKKRKRFLGIF